MLQVTILTGALAAALTASQGLVFPPVDAIAPAAVCAALAALACYYETRGEQAFVLCFTSLGILVGFSTVFSMLTYAIAATARPWADDALAASDAAMGLSAAAVVHWFGHRPTLMLLCKAIYFSSIPQTALAIAVLGLANDRRRMELFLTRFMIGALVTAGAFYLWPARGSCASGDVAVPDHYATILAHLDAMRSGASNVVSWRGSQGLVTFPSFHTIWSALFIVTFRRHWLFVPMALLNVLVIATTIPIGLHYFSDVVGGLVITAGVVMATLPASE